MMNLNRACLDEHRSDPRQSGSRKFDSFGAPVFRGGRMIIDFEMRRTTMRTTPALIGSIVALGAGLALAAGLPQQRAGGGQAARPAPNPPAASAQPGAPFARSLDRSCRSQTDRRCDRGVHQGLRHGRRKGLERLFHRRRGPGGPSGNRNAREGRSRLDVRRVISRKHPD